LRPADLTYAIAVMSILPGIAIVLLFLLVYFALLFRHQSTYRRIISAWLSQNGFELLRLRPFIIYWDDIVPPSYDLWIWAMLRVVTRDRDGQLHEAWVICKEKEFLVTWESGKIDRFSPINLELPPKGSGQKKEHDWDAWE
jgi:hypothetical protein